MHKPAEISKMPVVYAVNNKFDVVNWQIQRVALAVDVNKWWPKLLPLKKQLRQPRLCLVVDSHDAGCRNTAKAFNDRLNFDGVVLTKIDGDTCGGAASSIKYTVENPLSLYPLEEKMDALDGPHPERMVQENPGTVIFVLVEKVPVSNLTKFMKNYGAESKSEPKTNFDFNDFLA